MNKYIKYFFLLSTLFIFFFSFSTKVVTRQRGGFFSDEGAYYPITQSIAYDLDLKYTRKDIVRIRERFKLGPNGLFLKKVKNGDLYYAKSFAYPVFAAPFFRLFHEKGLLLMNGLMILLAIWMGFILLKKFHSEAKSFFFALMFVSASVVPIYIWWLQADLFNFFMMFCGLFFLFYPFKHKKWLYLSSLFFATVVFSKPSTIIAIAIVYVILMIRGEWKKFIILSLISLFLLGGFFLINYLETGEFNYMGGDRRTFYTSFPYDQPEMGFEINKLPKMSADNYWKRFYVSPRMVIMNIFYYIFGRFSGMFIYFFPAFFILILFFIQKKIPEDWVVFSAILLSILFYVTITPSDYMGGGGTLGNRYFLSIYPLFFFLGFRNREFRMTILPAVIAMIFLSAPYIDGSYHSTQPRYVGINTPASLFPPEKTQYYSVPTNVNPRNFGKMMRVEKNTYHLYFLTDNFWDIEENAFFWTEGDKKLEFFLAAPGEVKEFEIALKNIPVKNRIFFQVEHQRKRLQLPPGESCVIRFKNIYGLKIKDKYIYHIKIRSSESYSPFLQNPPDKDTRTLGVKSQIRLKY